MLVNYRERPVGPIVFFLLFVLVCLIGMPLWALRHYGTPQGPFAGKLILAPALGLLYLVVIVRTFIFNARVRRDPRALQWNCQGISLWQNGRFETVPWPQVSQVSVRQGHTTRDVSLLRIVTRKPDGRTARWVFPTGRLDLSGLTAAALAGQIEQARGGAPVVATPTPADRQAAAERYDERVAAARGMVAMVMSVYFITLVGMIVYLSSSSTMLLTPHDPLLWRSAKIGFLGTSGAMLLWYAKTIGDRWPISWRVALWFFQKTMIPAVFFAAMIGLWGWLAANVFVTARTFGADVHHGTVLMAAEPWVDYHGQPRIHAHLINRPGQDVFFTIAEADKKSMDEWYRPGVPEDAACVTVPVEWSGYAIRAEVRSDQPLPRGSVTGCS